MVNDEEYLKAIETVQKYEKERNKRIVKDHTCCVCKNNKIKKIDSSNTHPLLQNQGMWLDGCVDKITPGYGSSYDMQSFFIAICDDCIKDLLEKDLIIDIKKLKKLL